LDEVQVAPLFTLGLSAFTSGNEDWRERKRGMRAAFDALAMGGAEACANTMGMKVAVESCDLAMDLVHSIRENFSDASIILVRRRDLVAQYASLCRARETGVWHSWQQAGEREVVLNLPVDAFTRYAAEVGRVNAHLSLLRDSNPTIELVYEVDIAASDWQRVFSFLDLAEVEPTWLKMNKVAPPVESYISNHDALRAALETLPQPGLEELREQADAHAAETLRKSPASLTLSRASDALQARDFDKVERLALVVLAREGGLAPSQVRSCFELLEKAWEGLASGPRAERCLESLAAEYGGCPDYLHLRAVVRLHSGRPADAAADLRRALAIDPGFGRAATLVDEIGSMD
jgi:LPS sulfotransferase NodH